MSQTAQSAIAVTLSDSVQINPGSVALYVGTGGNLSILPAMGDVAVVLKDVQAGSVIPVRVRRVNLTGTTAADIVALY